MGRTIPSFRIAIAMKKKEWKPFRNGLDKKDRCYYLVDWPINNIRCLESR
jgi:hypothetical protein